MGRKPYWRTRQLLVSGRNDSEMHPYTKLLSGAAAILFDLDGTLIDSNEAQARAWADVFAGYGHRLDARSLKPLLGLETRALVARAVGPVSEEMAAHLDGLRWKTLRRRYLSLVHPVAKSNELLVLLRLRGLSTFLVSQAGPQEQKALLCRGGLEGQFPVPGRTVVGRRKGDLLLSCLAGHELEPGQCLVVADSVDDGYAAREAGMRFLAVEGREGGEVGLGYGATVAPSLGALFRALSAEPCGLTQRDRVCRVALGT